MNPSLFLKEVETSLQQLAAETDAVRKSELFCSYLNTMASFWQYSYHNQLLIHLQMPEATRVGDFKAWKALNRYVKKGSKGIKVLAPSFRKVEVDPSTLEEEQEAVFFFPVSVFDISQTEGKPLPEVNITVDGDDYAAFRDALLNFCAKKQIKVDFKHLGINGLYGYSSGGRIAVSDKESVNTQVNTLIHEIAHELLHKGSSESKQAKEIQAEGTAYVVCRHFGLANKSQTYLALYEADAKAILANFKAITEASREIIGYVDGLTRQR
ncbi:hypothetical protein HZB02_02475 [Candidatus Woesearchaeota archaeon]|nr:hypothetical protein [Candidatus Woesearchaeota archaeon]